MTIGTPPEKEQSERRTNRHAWCQTSQTGGATDITIEKGNIGETPERLGGAHMGFPERIHAIVN